MSEQITLGAVRRYLAQMPSGDTRLSTRIIEWFDDGLEEMTMCARCRPLAEQIASDLFTNGEGNRAERLVMLSKDGHDLGGWCYASVVERVCEALTRTTKSTNQIPKSPSP